MKRFLIAFVFIILIPSFAFAQGESEEEYSKYLSSYDLGFFEKTLDKDSYSMLEDLGITDFKYDSFNSLTPEKIFIIIKDLFLQKIKSPLSNLLTVLVFICLSSFFQGMKTDESDLNETFSTVSALIISALLVVKVSPVITVCVASLNIASNFMYAFVPVFAGILIASGNIAASLSTNGTLLAISGALSFISGKVIMPVINSFLAIGICSSLRHQLNLSRLVSTLKKTLISAMSFFCGVYVSIVSLKTNVASSADRLSIRSARFAINSVVPVVGGALSEGLLSIQCYSSLIKSSVGIAGIIALIFIFLPSVIEVALWRAGLKIALIISDVFDDKSVTDVLTVFSDTMLLINVLLIISMLTTVISIGILINTLGVV